MTAFNSVTSNIISGCIEKSEEHLLKFYSYIKSIDNEDNESDGEDSESDGEDDSACSSSDEDKKAKSGHISENTFISFKILSLFRIRLY